MFAKFAKIFSCFYESKIFEFLLVIYKIRANHIKATTAYSYPESVKFLSLVRASTFNLSDAFGTSTSSGLI